MGDIKHVACYCRVSTEEQAKYGFSIQAQKDALEKYCKQNKYKYEFYIDEGISASSMKRPALLNMLNKVNIYDMILFTKLDRLSRNVLDANTINKKLQDNHCTMKAIDEDDIDTSTADGTFIFNLKVSLAQREIGKTSERIKFVFDNKREKGEVTSGTRPFGYDIKDHKFVINEKEANKVVEFYKYFISVAGDTELSYNYFKEHFPHKSYDAYKKCIKNTNYIGKYKRYRKNEYIDNYIPRIMDDDLFFQVQNLLSKRRRIVKNNKEAPITLFDGLLSCAKCGSAMSRQITYRGDKTYISYKCWKIYKLSSKENQKYRCDNTYTICENKIESKLLEIFKEEAEKYILNNKAISITAPVKDYSNDILKIKRKLNKLKDLYIDDLIDKDDYKKDYEKLTSELNKLENQNVKTETASKKDLSHLEKIINSDFKTLYLNLNRIEKRRFWVSIIEKIYIEKDEIKGIEFS